MTTFLRYPPGWKIRRLIDTYLNRLAAAGPLATAPGRGQADPVAESSVSAEVPLAWYNPNNSTLIQERIDAGGFLAWRAQSNDEITWGPGPANYAASLVSVEGNAVSLIEGNGPVPWAAATGWNFVPEALQYFDTNIVPRANQDQVLFGQFSHRNAVNQAFAAQREGAGRLFGMFIQFGALVTYQNGNQYLENVPQVAGNEGVASNKGYQNGIATIGNIGNYQGAMTLSLFLGARNFFGAADFWASCNIQAMLYCDSAVAFTAPDIAAITALPDGSMHNL